MPRCYGANAKVSNLINMLPAARHDMLVLSDSDIAVGPRLAVAGHRRAGAARRRHRHLSLYRRAGRGRPQAVVDAGGDGHLL